MSGKFGTRARCIAALTTVVALVGVPEARSQTRRPADIESTSPPARQGAAMAYDSARQRVVLYGGRNGAVGFDDTWEWDGSVWQRIPATGPSARFRAGMTYDADHGVCVLIGGQAINGDLNSETWLWDGADWVIASAAIIPPMDSPGLAHDPLRHRVVLMGGYLGFGTSSTTYEWNGSAWAQISTGSPPTRAGHRMAWDSQRSRMVLYGGSSSGFFSDTWQRTGPTWANSGAAGPAARHLFGMDFDSSDGRTYLFGGRTSTTVGSARGDMQRWNGSQWQSVPSPGGPTARFDMPMVYDAAHGEFVLFGGADITERVLGDTWTYSGAEGWVQRNTGPLRVNPQNTGPADGLTWATGYASLQQALTRANNSNGAVTEIWLRSGAYKPAPAGSARTSTFSVNADVRIFGGFAGVDGVDVRIEPGRTGTSVLNGDLTDNDDGTPPSTCPTCDNTYHVVTVAAGRRVLLDRVSISAGRADGAGVDSGGAGVLAMAGSDLTLSRGTIDLCVSTGDGGGLRMVGGARLGLQGCFFIDNDSTSGSGGGIAASGAEFYATESEFIGNTAAGVGGGVSIAAAFVTLRYTRFQHNASHGGGGAYLAGGVLAQDSSFVLNRALGGGDGGGAWLDGESSSRIFGCLFARNSAEGNGGGLRLSGGAAVEIGSSTIAFNAARATGGVSLEQPGVASVYNSILHSNADGSGQGAPAQVTAGPDGSPWIVAAHSIVTGGIAGGDHVLDADPRFADPDGADNVPGTPDDGFSLFAFSPAIDAGSRAWVPPDELDLNSDGDTGEPAGVTLDMTSRFVDDPLVPDTGFGPSPVIDIGATETLTAESGSIWIGPNTSDRITDFANWLGGTPLAPGATGIFDFNGAQTIHYRNEGTTNFGRFIASGGDTSLVIDSSSAGMVWRGGGSESLLVGPWTDTDASFSVQGGHFTTDRVVVGRLGGAAEPILTLTPQTSWQINGTLRADSGTIVFDSANLNAQAIELNGTGTFRPSTPPSRFVRPPVVNNGVLVPFGSTTGVLTLGEAGVSTPYTQPLGTLRCQLGGVGPTDSDRLLINGPASLGGSVEVGLIRGYVPAAGMEHILLEAESLLGRFRVAFLPALPGGRYFRIGYALGGVRGQPGAVVLEQGVLNGEVNLDEPRSFPLGQGIARAAAVGDLNQDGLNDLAIAVQDRQDPFGAAGSIVILFNGGSIDSVWQGFSSSLVLNAGVNPSGVAIGSFDGTNGADLAVTNETDGTCIVYLQASAAGTFDGQTPLEVCSSPTSVAAPDLDRDGFSDLAITCAGDDTVAIYLREQQTRGGGEGGFVLEETVPVDDEPEDVRPFDPDGDKDSDLAIGNKGAGTVTVIRNRILQGFGINETTGIRTAPGTIGLAAGQLGQDGFDDLVSANQAGGSISVVASLSQGGQDPLQFSQAATTTGLIGPTSVALMDLERDGDLDVAALVVSETRGAAIKLFRNDSDQEVEITLAAGEELPAGASPVEVLAADLNGDRAPDLIAVNDPGDLRGGGASSVEVFLNTSIPACACDWNGHNGLDSQDFFEFLDSFFAADADFNGQGGTDSQDYFDFLECFFSGCSQGS